MGELASMLNCRSSDSNSPTAKSTQAIRALHENRYTKAKNTKAKSAKAMAATPHKTHDPAH